MPDIRFEPSTDGDKITLSIQGIGPDAVDEAQLSQLFRQTEFRRYYLNPQSLEKACKIFRKLQQEQRQNQSQASTAPDLPQPSDDPAISTQAQTVSLVVAERRDAQISVEISDDRMQAFLLLETAFGGRNPDINELLSQLKDAGVITGIRSDVLEGLHTRIESLPPGSRIKECVAAGTRPGESRQAALEFQVEPVQDRLNQPLLRDDGTVDMHDFGEIPLVKAGDVLIVRTPAVKGEPGLNVLGEAVAATEPADRALTVGEGTELDPNNPDVLRATRTGVAVRAGAGLMVADAYVVKDVDLTTGNISFDGTVLIQGSVKEGFSVKATGDVIVRDFVESASVSAGRNLVIGKGVLGRQSTEKEGDADVHLHSAHLSCGENLQCAYAQYADIQAGGNVMIGKHLMHCVVRGQAIQVVGASRNDGRIIGGRILPMQSLECNTLGAPSYIPTEVDFRERFASELDEIRAVNDEVTERVKVIRGMQMALQNLEGKKATAEAAEQLQKIHNTIAHFAEEIEKLKQRRARLQKEHAAILEELFVDIHKELYPGVSLSFGEFTETVKEEKKVCRVRVKESRVGYFTLN